MTTLEMNATKERPILFSGEMVRAIFDGRKTQTRRAIKPQPPSNAIIRPDGEIWEGLTANVHRKSPYGQPGDRLWLREAWAIPCDGCIPVYCADQATAYENLKWKPSIHMRREYSRITLEITGVRVERVQDISVADILSEGVEVVDNLGQCRINTADGVFSGGASWCYLSLWDSINEKRGYGWDVNPYVWVVEFKRVTPATTPRHDEVK